MKKLRMIVTSVIVLAIVGGAFAFKTKAGAFCILDNAISGTNCTGILSARKITTDPLISQQYKYVQNWDGNSTNCTAVNNHLCTGGPIKLTIND